MRISPALVSAAWLAAASPGMAQVLGPTTQAPACEATGATCLVYQHPNHRNCGTRGGPGCRKANGQCAAWRDGYVPDCTRLGNDRRR